MSDVNKQLLERWAAFGKAMQKAGSELPRHLISETEQAIAATEQAQQNVEPCFVCGTAVYYKQHSDQDCACRDEFNGSAVLCQKCLASMLRDQPTAAQKP